MADPEAKRRSNRKWYGTHRLEYNAKRREKYANDKAYREKQQQNARNQKAKGAANASGANQEGSGT